MNYAARCLSLCLYTSLAAFSAAFTTQAAEIPKGSHILLKMMNSVSTRTAAPGNQVYLQTAIPVAVDGQIVVPAGSYVQGIVSMAKRGGRVSGRAELAIRLETLTLPTGKSLHIAPRLSSIDSAESGQKVDEKENTVQQAPGVGKDAGHIAIMAGSGAAIGGLAARTWKSAGIGAGAGTVVGLATALLTRGADVELPQGSTMDIVFDRDVTIE
jgi:hypothetical protein